MTCITNPLYSDRVTDRMTDGKLTLASRVLGFAANAAGIRLGSASPALLAVYAYRIL